MIKCVVLFRPVQKQEPEIKPRQTHAKLAGNPSRAISVLKITSSPLPPEQNLGYASAAMNRHSVTDVARTVLKKNSTLRTSGLKKKNKA